ncbi:MAG: AzlD domain-containing protein [Enterococcus lacertideformus]|uniref:AzlD domain-containing protein n=1 Tax=Enterococcus lacertideformus TaxID=2771493 RepID=A0A931B2I7_9ENTE|nr:AzlD domain-containing protein [Enterococcus lacertideformus]
MTKTYLLLLVLSLFAVAYVPRLFPMLYFTHRKVPAWFSEWMKYVPVALFAALAFKDVFITHDHLALAWNTKILAMVFVAGVAYKTRSMALSVLTGLASVFLLSLF